MFNDWLYPSYLYAPVTDISTVNTLLKHSVSICDRLNLLEIALVFDEAIYSKALMIRWPKNEFRKRTGYQTWCLPYCYAIQVCLFTSEYAVVYSAYNGKKFLTYLIISF